VKRKINSNNNFIGSERKQNISENNNQSSTQYSLFSFSPSPLVIGDYDEAKKIPQESLVQHSSQIYK